MSKGFASSYRIVLLGVTLFACFAALGVRLIWLHVIEREVLLRTIARVRPMLIAETARRGDILDARGARLATSRSEIILGVDPHALRPKDAKKWSELAALLELPEAELRQKFTPRYNAPVSPAPVVALVPVVETPASDAGTSMHFNVTPQPTVSGPDLVVGANELNVAEEGQGPRPITWVILKDPVSETLYERINKLNVHGVYGLREYRRAYPSNQLASHIVGYVNREQQAAAGIEACVFADVLADQFGEQVLVGDDAAALASNGAEYTVEALVHCPSQGVLAFQSRYFVRSDESVIALVGRLF